MVLNGVRSGCGREEMAFCFIEMSCNGQAPPVLRHLGLGLEGFEDVFSLGDVDMFEPGTLRRVRLA